jgi:hypothetical protein
VEDNVGVEEGVGRVSSNSFELPPCLALALEALVDLEAGAADFDFVTRMRGRPNLVGSFKIVIAFGSTV